MPRPDELATRLRAAADAQDLSALHALVDWELTGAVPLARALADVDQPDRAAIAARGLAEIDRSTRDADLTRSPLGELLRALAGGELAPAPAGDAVRVPPTPPGLDGDQERRLDELRTRAAAITGALAIKRAGRADRMLPIAPGGDRVVLTP